MSRIKVDRITDRAGTGEPLFPNGVKVVGLTSLSNVVAGIATFENVSIGGTLTYDDVTNIDSVGFITARKGIISNGIVTATSFDGNLTGTPTLGTGVTVYSSGIVSATTFDGNLTGDLTGNPVLGTGVTVYSSGIVSCTTINATSAVNINNKAAATTGKAIAMAMVFG